MSQPDNERVYLNGILYYVLETRVDGTLSVCRPNGIKLVHVERLPDHPVYGEQRVRRMEP